MYEGFEDGFDDDVMYDVLGVSKSYRPTEKKQQSLRDVSRELKKVDPKQWKKLFGPNTKMGKQLKKQQQQEVESVLSQHLIKAPHSYRPSI